MLGMHLSLSFADWFDGRKSLVRYPCLLKVSSFFCFSPAKTLCKGQSHAVETCSCHSCWPGERQTLWETRMHSQTSETTAWHMRVPVYRQGISLIPDSREYTMISHFARSEKRKKHMHHTQGKGVTSSWLVTSQHTEGLVCWYSSLTLFPFSV